MSNEFDCLLQPEILGILIGKAIFGEQKHYSIRMPYYRENAFTPIMYEFGFSSESFGSDSWFCIDALLRHANQTNTTSDLLVHLFKFENFKELLAGLTTRKKKEDAHREIIKAVILGINKNLTFAKKELLQHANSFHIVQVNAPKIMESEAVKIIDSSYIHELSSRIQTDFNNSNFDSVLGKSRTLVEEVLIYILEQKQEPCDHKGNLGKLFNQVKISLNIHQSKESDKEKFDQEKNSMLSGLEKIIQAVIKIRNTQSDSHGAGTKRITIHRHEAQLVVNSAITFADYVFSEYTFQKNKTV